MKRDKLLLIALIVVVMSSGAVALDLSISPQEKEVPSGGSYTLEAVVAGEDDPTVKLTLPLDWTYDSTLKKRASEGDKIILNTKEGQKKARRLEFRVRVPEDAEGTFNPKVSALSKSKKSMVGGIGVMQQTVRVVDNQEKGEQRERKGRKSALEEAGTLVLDLLEKAADLLI